MGRFKRARAEERSCRTAFSLRPEVNVFDGLSCACRLILAFSARAGKLLATAAPARGFLSNAPRVSEDCSTVLRLLVPVLGELHLGLVVSFSQIRFPVLL